MKKKNIIILIIILVLIASGIVLLFTKEKKNHNEIIQEDNIDYDRVVDIVNNEKEAIIYYYDTLSSDTIHNEIKDYLDNLKIKYYLYDAAKIDNEEYSKILTALDIDSELFGLPAIIYIYNGKVYSNIININDIEIVKHYVEENELTTVKSDNTQNQT